MSFKCIFILHEYLSSTPWNNQVYEMPTETNLSTSVHRVLLYLWI